MDLPHHRYHLIGVAPGSFKMGSPPDEASRGKAEGPLTQVTLSQGYWLGATEMTQETYAAITGESRFTESGPQAPVERVSWKEAMRFCRKLAERVRAAGRLPIGYAYTLPTEAQWEYAYRADSSSAYPGEAETMAWCDKKSAGATHPVGQLQPNDWGFCDMSGKVLECATTGMGIIMGAIDPRGPKRG